MVYLALSAYFKLPEDFKGSFSDGLRLLAKCLERKSKKPLPATRGKVPPLPVRRIFPVFLEVVRNGGSFAGACALQRLSKNGKRWIDIPTGIKP
jgi:hypothetical protein